jgi:tRNA 5-methylaminomethyl-2-thiouridine biosynthesis bifunctional protein
MTLNVSVTPEMPGPPGEPALASPGALARARRLTLEATALPARWQGRSSITVLDTSFGCGLNLLAAWDALRGDRDGRARLNYVALAVHPYTRSDLTGILSHLPELRPLAVGLAAVWPPPISGFHRVQLDAGRVSLTLLFGEMRASLAALDAKVDAFILDQSGGQEHSELWSPEALQELARLAAPGATLATRTATAGARAALEGAGFRVTRREAKDGAESLLTATFPGTSALSATPRQAIVVGAGLAGTLCADRLASRGISVTLIDPLARREAGAIGLLRPIANLRDATNARLSRPAFLYALQHFRNLQQEGYHLAWGRCGALHLAEGDDEAERFSAIASAQGYPQEFLRFVDSGEARQLAGREVRGPGWWIASGAWVAHESLSVATFARAGTLVERRTGTAVASLERDGGEWQAFDGKGSSIARAPVVVLANAADCARFALASRLILNRVRGQVSYLPASLARTLETIVCGSGYVAPMPDGGHCLGATFQNDDPDGAVRAADHRENLARAEAMLPGFCAGLHPMGLDGWTGFRTTTHDRLPVFGRLDVGLYAATGLGSRGLLWGPLGAELIASDVAGDPVPLPRVLAGAVSPARFRS